jgi:hypothetical protein
MVRFPKFITTLFVVAVSYAAVGQTEISRAATYINQYRELAIAEMLRTGVPPSITLAQGILETAGGQSDLASMANNHFGIKCKSEWKGETMLHDDDAKGECFRKYPNVEASFQDHSDFLKSRPNYAFLFKLDPNDYEGWAKGLKKAGYATSPTYAQRLMKIIVENNLQQVTLVALERRQNGETEIFAVNDTKTPGVSQPVFIEKEESVATTTVAVSKSVAQSKSGENILAPSRKYPVDQVFTINETKVIYAQTGTSLLAMANNFNLTYKKILEFNELNEVDIISRDQLIFLQKKPKRGNKDVHVVEADENLHEICQKEGIQMVSLMEYNRLQKGMEPAKGEKLYLKFPAPVAPKLAGSEASLALNRTK